MKSAAFLTLREYVNIQSGKLRVERIKKSWQEQKEIKNIMLFLQSHNVRTSHATKIYKTYGDESVKMVQENPYRLADDIWGIGFRTADTIAEKMGFGHEQYPRLMSGFRENSERHHLSRLEQTVMSSRENWLREDLFERLSRSRFRIRFKLTEADRKYIAEKGWDTIREHAAQIVEKRLAPTEPIA